MRWLLVVGLCLLGGRVRAQNILPASTGCIGDSIVTKFRPDIEQDTFSRAELDAHEAVHRAQIRHNMAVTGKGCAESFWMLTASAEANLEAEVPAYRAQAEWLRAHVLNFDEDRYYEFVAQRLYAFYWPQNCKSEPSGGVECPLGTKPLPYNYIVAYLRLGNRPGQMAAPEFPKPNYILAADTEKELWSPSP